MSVEVLKCVPTVHWNLIIRNLRISTALTVGPLRNIDIGQDTINVLDLGQRFTECTTKSGFFSLCEEFCVIHQ